jgi:two-component system, sensor histidine kinase and response regulator
MTKAAPKILIVDDQPINIKIIQRKIEKAGMEVLVASNGAECIGMVQEHKPDIVLLDIMMPEMDGIETCRKLKEDPETKDTPIIFITAKSAKEDVLTGLDTGAVDYITKPLELDETLARIRTQLRVQQMHRENMDLMQRLAEIRRTSTVGAITQGIAHNLNNLLGVVVGYIDLMKIGKNRPEMIERSINSMESAIHRMVTIVSQLSSMAAQEDIPTSHVPVALLFENTIKRYHQEYSVSSPVDILIQLPENYSININSEMFESALGKLLINAWEAYPNDTHNRPVKLSASAETDPANPRVIRAVFIDVLDRGTGINEEVADNFYEPFITTKTSVGRGMGLTVARHSLRNMGCDLFVEDRTDGAGVRARIRIGNTSPAMIH